MNRRERRAQAKSGRETPAPREETFVEKQVRLVLEGQCREIADKLKAMCPAGTGFALFLMDYGSKGNLAYVATVDRADMIKTVQEWPARELRTGDPDGAMRQAVRAINAGVKLPAELEGEVDRDAAWSVELSDRVRREVLIPWCHEHAEAGPDIAGGALIQVAALHLMAGLGMGPDDFGEFARATAELFKDEARAIREQVKRRGQS